MTCCFVQLVHSTHLNINLTPCILVLCIYLFFNLLFLNKHIFVYIFMCSWGIDSSSVLYTIFHRHGPDDTFRGMPCVKRHWTCLAWSLALFHIPFIIFCFTYLLWIVESENVNLISYDWIPFIHELLRPWATLVLPWLLKYFWIPWSY